METNQIPQPKRIVKREWSQEYVKLNKTDVEKIIELYKTRFSLSSIARIYRVHQSSVRYHLEKAGVYVKWQTNHINYTFIKVSRAIPGLDYNEKAFLGYEPHYDDGERNFPKSYKEYLQREKDRTSILKKNGYNDPFKLNTDFYSATTESEARRCLANFTK